MVVKAIEQESVLVNSNDSVVLTSPEYKKGESLAILKSNYKGSIDKAAERRWAIKEELLCGGSHVAAPGGKRKRF